MAGILCRRRSVEADRRPVDALNQGGQPRLGAEGSLPLAARCRHPPRLSVDAGHALGFEGERLVLSSSRKRMSGCAPGRSAISRAEATPRGLCPQRPVQVATVVAGVRLAHRKISMLPMRLASTPNRCSSLGEQGAQSPSPSPPAASRAATISVACSNDTTQWGSEGGRGRRGFVARRLPAQPPKMLRSACRSGGGDGAVVAGRAGGDLSARRRVRHQQRSAAVIRRERAVTDASPRPL